MASRTILRAIEGTLLYLKIIKEQFSHTFLEKPFQIDCNAPEGLSDEKGWNHEKKRDEE